jgi:hypothetical protein
MNFLFKLINGAAQSFGESATAINDKVEAINSQAYLENSLIFSLLFDIFQFLH